MKEIPLTQGQSALVDDDDYEYLNQFKWMAWRHGNTFYAIRHAPTKDGKRDTIRMHVVVIETPNGMDTDHINGNGLDNRKENLRIVTHRENNQNNAIHRSGCFPGVRKDKRLKTHPYTTCIRVGKQRPHLGSYATPEEAYHVYKLACWLYDFPITQMVTT
jgi:hypothetical protein